MAVFVEYSNCLGLYDIADALFMAMSGDSADMRTKLDNLWETGEKDPNGRKRQDKSSIGKLIHGDGRHKCVDLLRDLRATDYTEKFSEFIVKNLSSPEEVAFVLTTIVSSDRFLQQLQKGRLGEIKKTSSIVFIFETVKMAIVQVHNNKADYNVHFSGLPSLFRGLTTEPLHGAPVRSNSQATSINDEALCVPSSIEQMAYWINRDVAANNDIPCDDSQTIAFPAYLKFTQPPFHLLLVSKHQADLEKVIENYFLDIELKSASKNEFFIHSPWAGISEDDIRNMQDSIPAQENILINIDLDSQNSFSDEPRISSCLRFFKEKASSQNVVLNVYSKDFLRSINAVQKASSNALVASSQVDMLSLVSISQLFRETNSSDLEEITTYIDGLNNSSQSSDNEIRGLKLRRLEKPESWVAFMREYGKRRDEQFLLRGYIASSSFKAHAQELLAVAGPARFLNGVNADSRILTPVETDDLAWDVFLAKRINGVTREWQMLFEDLFKRSSKSLGTLINAIESVDVIDFWEIDLRDWARLVRSTPGVLQSLRVNGIEDLQLLQLLLDPFYLRGASSSLSKVNMNQARAILGDSSSCLNDPQLLEEIASIKKLLKPFSRLEY
jgi:hypothetical protein